MELVVVKWMEGMEMTKGTAGPERGARWLLPEIMIRPGVILKHDKRATVVDRAPIRTVLKSTEWTEFTEPASIPFPWAGRLTLVHL